MIITPINSFSNQYNKYQSTQKTPNFKANYRVIWDSNGELLYRTTTYFFRNDIDWDKFAEFINNKYRLCDKVNVINYACSNGMEPYSLVAKLISVIGKQANKFFPIAAKDIDANNIEMAKKGLYPINDLRLSFSIADSNRWLLEQMLTTSKDCLHKEIVPGLKEKVDFVQADMLKEVGKQQLSNSIVLCRNVWDYLPRQRWWDIMGAFRDCMDGSSLLVVGDMERTSGATYLLKKTGFVETEVKNVFTMD